MHKWIYIYIKKENLYVEHGTTRPSVENLESSNGHATVALTAHRIPQFLIPRIGGRISSKGTNTYLTHPTITTLTHNKTAITVVSSQRDYRLLTNN